MLWAEELAEIPSELDFGSPIQFLREFHSKLRMPGRRVSPRPPDDGERQRTPMNNNERQRRGYSERQ
jgi:hypothetical protein